MTRAVSTIVLAALAFISSPGVAKSPPPVWPELGKETSIPFANFHGIRNYETDGNDGLWLEDSRHRWYYATVAGPCWNLDFAQQIGYDTRGSTTFDKFSAIIVGQQRCQILSVVTANKPLPRKERLKLREEVRQSAKDVVAPK